MFLFFLFLSNSNFFFFIFFFSSRRRHTRFDCDWSSDVCSSDLDNNAFLSQAQQYRLPEKVKLLTEIVDLASIRAVGDALLGLIGSSRDSFSYDHPLNNEFVALWKKEHGTYPDTFEG